LKEFATLFVVGERQSLPVRQLWMSVDKAHERLGRPKGDAQPLVVWSVRARRDRVRDPSIGVEGNATTLP
jgi:hypothetical protein